MDEKTATRFWSKVDRRGPDECWEWQASTLDCGYGQFWLNGRLELSHRVSWSEENGTIPEGIDILHKCDNRPCCNPRHLFPGTDKDNSDDCIAKGRRASFSGRRNGRAGLTDGDVAMIREAYATGNVNQIELSGVFGVTQGHISRIVRGDEWKQLPCLKSPRRVPSGI